MEDDSLKIIGYCQITGLPLKSKDSWEYKSDSYFIHPYVIGDGSIIIVNSNGKPSIETIKFGIKVFKKISEEFADIKRFVLISDQKNVKMLPTGARRLYIDYIKDHSNVIAAIFYNVTAVTRLSLKLGKSISNTKVKILATNSYEESINISLNLLNINLENIFMNDKKRLFIKNTYFNIINKFKNEYFLQIKNIINYKSLNIKEELNFLNEFLLNIDWKEKNDKFDIYKLNNSPFSFIYETIMYIKSDLYNLIEERDNQKKELEILNTQLEKKVVERTQELSLINKSLLEEISRRKDIEKSLIKAKELAENSNKSKSIFIANISHELKTPMNSILGYSSIGIQKIEKVSKNKLKSYFENINKSGKRLLILLDDLIDVAKLENLEIKYDFIKIEIIGLLKTSIKEIKYQALEKNIKIIFSKNDYGAYYINIDKKRIRQVFDNILTNAIKFTPKNKKIEIDITKDNESIFIDFKDEGPGIESCEVFKIFDSFYQGVRTKDYSTFGTGLGLAISKKIILAHNGKIWAYNREDKKNGSIFTIMLPINN